MATLLLQLSGNKTLNRTIFPAHLFIYNDLLIYKKRKLFLIKEITISYGQISQVTLNKGIFFASLEVVTTGTDDFLIRFVPKKIALQAKKIIDQKIYQSHSKHHDEPSQEKSTPTKVEKSLTRLHELVQKGQISQKEYNLKKEQLIKSL